MFLPKLSVTKLRLDFNMANQGFFLCPGQINFISACSSGTRSVQVHVKDSLYITVLPPRFGVYEITSCTNSCVDFGYELGVLGIENLCPISILKIEKQ